MIAAVVYSEAGGTFKTTTCGNLAVAFERLGLDTLVIDLDPQEGGLTTLFDVGEGRHDKSTDNLVKHILEMPDGPFQDLIETSEEGVDIVPAHDMLSDFTKNLEQKISYETSMKDISEDEFPRYELLYDLLWECEGIQEEYDAVLIDPNARAEDLLGNAIYAMRTLIAPVKPAGKGNLSLTGLNEMVDNLEAEHGIEVGLSCVIPSGIGRTNAHRAYTQQFQESDFSTPVTIGDRESLMDEMWEARGSAFKVVEERWKTSQGPDGEMESQPGRRRIRDREVETLQKFVDLAWFVATVTFDTDPDSLNSQVMLEIDDYEDIALPASEGEEVAA